jgi:hypothetical protein
MHYAKYRPGLKLCPWVVTKNTSGQMIITATVTGETAIVIFTDIQFCIQIH